MSSFLPFKTVKIHYVLDSSVLAYHGEAIHSFSGHNVYLPIEVLGELDHLKTRMDPAGSACRYVNRYLDQLRDLGSLAEGVEIENQQTITIISDSNLALLPAGMEDTVDNRIIAVAAKLKLEGKEVVVVSKDISLRLRCDGLSIEAIDYEKNSFEKSDYFFDGISTIEVTKEMIDEFYATGIMFLENEDFYPNQGVILKCGKSSALAMALNQNTVKKLQYAGEKGFEVQGISPRSKEQIMACELLLDPNIDLVSIIGYAGTGKTLLSSAAALELIHKKKYKKLIICRPNHSTSKDIGFLPGSLEEKLSPWLQPFFDNFEIMLGSKGQSYLDLMFENGTIEMAALSYIRGRTLPNTIFIIDEAQNITHHEAKALLTRMGENSKIVLLGDLEQIDSPNVDQSTSGLASVMELFKEFDRAGHIRLKKGERSELATFAAKVM